MRYTGSPARAPTSTRQGARPLRQLYLSHEFHGQLSYFVLLHSRTPRCPPRSAARHPATLATPPVAAPPVVTPPVAAQPHFTPTLPALPPVTPTLASPRHLSRPHLPPRQAVTPPLAAPSPVSPPVAAPPPAAPPLAASPPVTPTLAVPPPDTSLPLTTATSHVSHSRWPPSSFSISSFRELVLRAYA